MSLCAEGAEGPGVNDPNAGGCTGLGSVSDCPFNFFFRKAGSASNSYVLLSVSRLIRRRHVKDAVCVNIKSNLNLRYPTWRG